MITFKMNSDTVYIIESRLLHKFGGVFFYKKEGVKSTHVMIPFSETSMGHNSG